MGRSGGRRLVVAAVATVVLLSACTSQLGPSGHGDDDDGAAPAETPGTGAPPPAGADDEPAGGDITLAFAGDVHFEGVLAELPGRPRSTLGPMSRDLSAADLAMVNLESAIASTSRPARKELEDPGNRYWFRTSASALGVMARSGVDVVTVANNHGADHGPAGLRETLRAGDGRVAVVGAGRHPGEAYRPHRATIRGTDVAVLAADASPRESAAPTWEIMQGEGPGLASARPGEARPLLAAVREAAQRDDVVVVYLHWGEELRSCPTPWQRLLARALAQAGADVVVGTHAHVTNGAGMLDDTYVSYGLGDFAWYHGFRPETGVLSLRLRGGEVVRDEWRPALIPDGGGVPRPVAAADRDAARQDWRDLRACTGLEPGPGERVAAPALPDFQASVGPLTPALRQRMTGVSHDPEVCPVGLGQLRLVVASHVGFDGEVRRGRIVVNADVADDVVAVLRELYVARWPIERMVLIDSFGGDDDRSMAANNSSGYNCRPVAGSTTWSQHAYGRAIDLNPVQNPYVTAGGVLPPAGRRFVSVDRSGPRAPVPGVIVRRDVVTRAFQERGWTWGGDWTEADYQHFDRR